MHKLGKMSKSLHCDWKFCSIQAYDFCIELIICIIDYSDWDLSAVGTQSVITLFLDWWEYKFSWMLIRQEKIHMNHIVESG